MISHFPVLHGAWSQSRLIYCLWFLTAFSLSRVGFSALHARQLSSTTAVEFCTLTREQFLPTIVYFFDVRHKWIKNARRARWSKPEPKSSRVDLVHLSLQGGGGSIIVAVTRLSDFYNRTKLHWSTPATCTGQRQFLSILSKRKLRTRSIGTRASTVLFSTTHLKIHATQLSAGVKQ